MEAVVFPSPRVQGRYLLLGFGFDDNSRGPSVTDMQWITDGIERLDGSGSGSGTSAGPRRRPAVTRTSGPRRGTSARSP
ncbi:hypothetical protein [Streptomyces sp. NPDC046197]|uniref:hypothetical protein n=1 Tax=Streptomyces sp. NPDC046197 TaxID=3154337 RepID=UPI0033EE17EF